MKPHPIHVTQEDLERLQLLIDHYRSSRVSPQDTLEDLAEELKRSRVVPSGQVPNDVVTMNSKVRLKDLKTGEENEYTLVFPQNADIETGKISVLAPIGTAMLGYRVGDVFEWNVPGGKARMRVKRILYQPQAAVTSNLETSTS